MVTAIAIVLTAAGAAPAGSARRPPAVRLASIQPLSVHGLRFRAGERVTVSYVSSVRRVRRVMTSRTGGFTVRFRDLTVDPCSAFSILALGASGDRGVLRHKPLPACAPS